MASVIPGYEYDIFISYRQKDNKGDKWVSEFVESLKTELESTFKEGISIYFDFNPHDGLLETHDVDASLNEKLKCAIFLPVLSRTYCDPNSFAWEHEFKTFIHQAANDSFGLNIKLPNGNLTSRVLPVRIHDLDHADIKSLTSYIDILHPIDFIFNSQGVNRPLGRRDDELIQDSKQPVYRDRINKTALAVREIILGMKGESGVHEDGGVELREQGRDFYQYKKKGWTKKSKLLFAAVILAIIIFAGILLIPEIKERTKLSGLAGEDGRITLAVMPFQNMTGDTARNYIEASIQNILITNLSGSEQLKVRQYETVTGLLQGKGLTSSASITPQVARTITQNLEASVYISGSLKQSGSAIRLNAQLISLKTQENIKSFQVDWIADNIMAAIDSLSVLINNYFLITGLEKKSGMEITSGFMAKGSTASPDAYRYYIYGCNAWLKLNYPEAIKLLKKSIELDTGFFQPYIWYISSYANLGMWEEAKEICRKVYKRRDHMPFVQQLWIDESYSILFKNLNEDVKCVKKLLEYDDQSPMVLWILGNRLRNLEQYDEAIVEFEKVLAIYEKWGIKPPTLMAYTEPGMAYRMTSQYDKAKTLYKKAGKDFPDYPGFKASLAILSLIEDDTVKADQYLEQYISMRKENSASEGSIAMSLATIYAEAGKPDSAYFYIKKAISLGPERPERLSGLARLLIFKDINIKEGMALIEKALAADPGNSTFLDVKGWGLYKSGKYSEALFYLKQAVDLNPVYDHEFFIHREAARKAVAEMK